MKHRIVAIAALAAFLIAGSGAFAATKLSPQPQGAEATFITAIQKDLNARFPNPAAAEAAGYFRYSNEDNTGAISYANTKWTSDITHPSQLWFDVKGNLLGADFSQPDAKTAPKLWGVLPARWYHFHPHVHYVYTDNGTTVYGKATSVKKFVAAGGSLTDPDAATVVKLGVVKDPSLVTHVFLFPAIWDLIVWVKPNPAGAFADKNPDVHPSANAEKMND
ncbi:MAG: hypothetical protein M3R30_01345 [Candidatus Eremiobacteraeota bacterium]|nr:hypothetical protein [Candidatus Eremiobacteraeota bacterium]